MNSEPGASDIVVEAWIAKRWLPIARSEDELAARRLFERASYKRPADILLRLRRGSDVLIKGRGKTVQTTGSSSVLGCAQPI